MRRLPRGVGISSFWWEKTKGGKPGGLPPFVIFAAPLCRRSVCFSAQRGRDRFVEESFAAGARGYAHGLACRDFANRRTFYA